MLLQFTKLKCLANILKSLHTDNAKHNQQLKTSNLSQKMSHKKTSLADMKFELR